MRFGLVGLVNTAVGLSAIYFLSWAVGLPPLAANAGGYIIGFTISFLLNRRWTFGDRTSSGALPRYLLVFCVSYCLNAIVLLALIGPLGIHENLAQLAAVCAYSLCFFVLCRIYVFKSEEVLVAKPSPENEQI